MLVRGAHIRFDVVSRRKGQNAVKMAAYGACARVTAADGQVFDFRRKSKELRGHEILLPPGAPAWAAGPELWRRCEAAENQNNSQVARICEMEIPRAVPPARRMEFLRHVAQIWVDEGMACQINEHSVQAADLGENCHGHFEMTMRRFEGDAFDAKKALEWNRMFRARAPGGGDGTAMKKQMCDRANAWLESNGIDVRLDWRKRNPAEFGPPEKDVSKKAWKAWQKDQDSAAAAPVREVLAARQMRRQLRQAKAATTYYEAATRAIGRELDSRRPGLRVPARKPGFAWDSKWTPKVEGYVAGVEIHSTHAAIDLTFGNQIRDFGNRITVTGKADWRAAMALADHAARRGLTSVEITGSDPKFRAALAAQLAARGIDATNERKPSAYAIEQARQLTAKALAPQPVPKPELTKQEPPKVTPRPPQPEPSGPKMGPTLIPPWARNPGWTASKNNNEGGRSS